MDETPRRRPWIPIGLLAPMLGLAACSPPGGSDEATVVPDPKSAVKARPIADGKAEVPAPAPPRGESDQP